MAHSPDTPKQTTFAQCCRDLISMLSYEDILACTIYLPPMLFMVGPATIVANSPMINLVLNAVIGFFLSWTLHRTGHRLLMALPNCRQALYLSHSIRLPLSLTLTQFLWMMEVIVAAALFSGIVGKRWLLTGDFGVLTGMICLSAGVALYFLPVYLGRLWIRRYYPAMPLSHPTQEAVSQSFPLLRFRRPAE